MTILVTDLINAQLSVTYARGPRTPILAESFESRRALLSCALRDSTEAFTACSLPLGSLTVTWTVVGKRDGDLIGVTKGEVA